jgi:two-component system OmpR family response regulator
MPWTGSGTAPPPTTYSRTANTRWCCSISGLPGRDGLEVLRRLRQAGNTVPVLVITARDGIDDRIKGLDFGADDYLVKPFDVNELLARLRAIIRRQGGHAAPLLSNGKAQSRPRQP